MLTAPVTAAVFKNLRRLIGAIFPVVKGLPNVSKYPTEVTYYIRFVLWPGAKLVNWSDPFLTAEQE
jgi:hypothetical protein